MSALAVASCATVLGLDDVQYHAVLNTSDGAVDASTDQTTAAEGSTTDGAGGDALDGGFRCGQLSADAYVYCADFEGTPVYYFRGVRTGLPSPDLGNGATAVFDAAGFESPQGAAFTAPGGSNSSVTLASNEKVRHVRARFRVKTINHASWLTGAVNLVRLHLDSNQNCYVDLSVEKDPGGSNDGKLHLSCNGGNPNAFFGLPPDGEWSEMSIEVSVPSLAGTVSASVFVGGIKVQTASTGALGGLGDHVQLRFGIGEMGGVSAATAVMFDDVVVEELP